MALEQALIDITNALQLATADQSFDKIQSLSIEYAATEARLESLMQEWEALAHEHSLAE